MDVGVVLASWLAIEGAAQEPDPCPEAGWPGQVVTVRLAFLKNVHRLFISALLGYWWFLFLLVPSCFWRILMAHP